MNNPRILFLFILTTGLLLWSAPLHAKSINLLGNWKAYFTGSEDENAADGFTQFRQRYDASWTPFVTSKIYLAANVNYTDTWLKNTGNRELINPALRISVNNDIFDSNLNFYSIKNNNSFTVDKHDYGWTADIASSWNWDLWPKLSFTIGQRWDESDITAYNGKENFGRASLKWQGYNIDFLYNYTFVYQDNDAQLNQSNPDQEGHLAKVKYQNNFWDNRLAFNFAQLFSQTDTEFNYSGADALLQVLLSNAYAADDSTPEAGSLPSNSALIDGNRDGGAFSIQLLQPANLAVRTNFNSIERLYVYTTRDNSLLVANTGALSWDLYTSDNGVTWQLAATDVPTTFNGDEFRFEVNTGNIQAGFVKLVVTGWIPTLDVNVTEIEAYTVLPSSNAGTFDSTTKQYKTDFNVNVLPVDSVRVNYTFSWDQHDTTGGRESETEQLVQTGNVNWNYSRYFMPSAGFSSAMEKHSNPSVPEKETYTYIVRVQSQPLSTLDLALNYSWNEYREDGDLERSSSNIFFSSTAALYPDLTTELNIGFTWNEAEDTGEKSDSTYINWLLRSRLRKSLYVDFSTSYSFVDSENVLPVTTHLGHGGGTLLDTSSEGGQSTLTISWRPSNVISMGLTGRTEYGRGGNNRDSLSLNLNYLAFRTSKTSLNLNYVLNWRSDRDTTNNFGLIWGWDLSEYFTLRTSGNYLFIDGRGSWNVYTQLTTKF